MEVDCCWCFICCNFDLGFLLVVVWLECKGLGMDVLSFNWIGWYGMGCWVFDVVVLFFVYKRCFCFLGKSLVFFGSVGCFWFLCLVGWVVGIIVVFFYFCKFLGVGWNVFVVVDWSIVGLVCIFFGRKGCRLVVFEFLGSWGFWGWFVLWLFLFVDIGCWRNFVVWCGIFVVWFLYFLWLCLVRVFGRIV